MTTLRARVASLLVLAFLLACDRSPRAVATDSTAAPVDSAVTDTTARAEPGWLPSLGSVVAVPIDSATGWLLHGDIEAVSTGATTVQLIDHDGGAATAEIVGTRRDGVGCELVNLAGAVPGTWSAAIGGTARPIPMQTLATLARPDSQRLVREMARMASRLPAEANDRFVGLPFVVAEMWTGVLTDSTPVAAARIRRQINQEASPMEEQIFVIAEFDADGWMSRYMHRARGSEETVVALHLLALLATAPPMMIVTRESATGTSLVLIERGSTEWQQRYISPRRSCP